MGRRKIEIKRIENTTTRQITFSKRRRGLMKKAQELAVLCDVELGLIVFSSTGKMFEYSSPCTRMQQIIDRYGGVSRDHNDDAQDQLNLEMIRLRNEVESLEMSMRHFMGEDLSMLNLESLQALEEQLEVARNRVRTWKRVTSGYNGIEAQMQMMNQSSSLVYQTDHLQSQDLLQQYSFPPNTIQPTSHPNSEDPGCFHYNDFQLWPF